MQPSEELIASALEFLETSCDQYANGEATDERRLKHSTINLSSGIELVLKARLTQEHWTLLLLSSDRYRQGDLERGSFQSVGLRETLARLSELCGLNISQQAETAFADLAELANRFNHFPCRETAERVTGIQLRAWHYLMDLIDQGLFLVAEAQASVFASIRSRMVRREEFLAARFDQAGPEITARADAGADIVMCPFCAHPALAVGNGATCVVCGSAQNQAKEYAEEYARRLSPWMSSEDYYNTQWAAMCSECRQTACVGAPEELRERCEQTIRESEGIDRDSAVGIDPWYCFNCGAVYDGIDIAECTRCGQLFARAGNESLCPSCSW